MYLNIELCEENIPEKKEIVHTLIIDEMNKKRSGIPVAYSHFCLLQNSSLPPSQRSKDQTDKAAAEPFDPDKLVAFLEEQEVKDAEKPLEPKQLPERPPPKPVVKLSTLLGPRPDLSTPTTKADPFEPVLTPHDQLMEGIKSMRGTLGLLTGPVEKKTDK